MNKRQAVSSMIIVFAVLSSTPATKPQKSRDNGAAASCEVPIFKENEVDKKAQITLKPEPDYPKEARPHRVSGTVILSIVLCRSGKVTDIKPIVRLPFGITEKAIEAARRIEFIRAEKGEQPVSQRLHIEYYFYPY